MTAPASPTAHPTPTSEAELDALRRARLAAPAEGGTPSLRRNPLDGWRMADPWPMSRSTLAALRGLIVALLPPPPAPAVPPERILEHSRRVIRYLPHVMTRGFVLTLHLLDWAPLWRFKSFHRLRSLPQDRAAAVLAGLGESRLAVFRQLIMAARGVVLSTYFDQPEVHEALGYDPVPFLRGRLALRARLLAGEPAAPEDMLGPFSTHVTADLRLPAPDAPRGARVAANPQGRAGSPSDSEPDPSPDSSPESGLEEVSP